MDERLCKDNDSISCKKLIDFYLDNVLKKRKPLNFEIYEKWDIIVQNKLREHLQIKEIKDDVLILAADHPAWLQKANMSKNNILKNIKKQIPLTNIKTIHIICR